eukprot:TRINITY_DN6895_c0_g1_i1.p1 TRINITY_DN6895_c0_g1~~TRINITY_DN6895_c0_g1_i1.p1  ORF type:complete len:292 (+),score=42.25 TRINITY_DN6895_c0_g1_i1:35-910(+)
MELAINTFSDLVINPFLSPEYHAPNYWLTQIVSIWTVLYIGAVLFYFAFAGFSYYLFFVWKKSTYYPDTLGNDLKDQINTEIGIAMRSFPVMAVLFTPFAFGVSRGWSKIYYNVDDFGWTYLILSVPLFLFVTDFMIYYIHRGLHVPWFYKNIHKPHHTYRYTTPFSSHAFHCLDGWAQGVPYYIFSYIFPFHHLMWLAMFIFVNMWTIMIHDQVDFTAHVGFVNSTGHHTIHHTEFNYNYGQYFTLWDKFNGTHKDAERTHDFQGNKLTTTTNKKTQKGSPTSSQKSKLK